MKKGTYKAVYVEWIDSTMNKQVWWNAKDLLEDNKKVHDRFQSIAYLVTENKLEYVFANSIHLEDDGNKFHAVAFGEIFSIPKGCVTKMKNITI